MKKSRRSFIKKIAGSSILLGAYPAGMMSCETNAQPLKTNAIPFAANDQINIAVIGCGIMGFNDCSTSLKVPGVKLVAACDLYDGRLEHMKELYGNEIFTTRNYKEVLDRKDVDAVIIATSDHWHDHISIAAMESGKAVYCEKPMVHHIDEGKAVIDAQKKTGAVFQVGSQRVSSIVTLKAKELLEQGTIGQLNMAEIVYDRQSALGAWQYSIPTDASEKTVDWKTYQGDAPKHAFDKKRFFRWRNYQDYGTGVTGDLFVHLFSGLHVITSSLGPNRIYATGGLRYWKDGRDVPDLMIGSYDYPETEHHPAFNVQMRVNFIDGSGGGSHVRLIGSEGVMTVTGGSVKVERHVMPKAPGYGGWDSFGTFPKATREAYVKWYKEQYPEPLPRMKDPKEEEFVVPEHYNSDLAHHMVFYNAVRTGTPIVEDATFGLRAAGPALASNLSYFELKPILWDAKAMEVV